MANRTADLATVDTHDAIAALRESIDAVEIDVLTSYTLADAMRDAEGAIDQGRNSWLTADSACALASAALSARARGYLS